MPSKKNKKKNKKLVYPDEKEFASTINRYQNLVTAFMPDKAYFKKHFPAYKFKFVQPKIPFPGEVRNYLKKKKVTMHHVDDDLQTLEPEMDLYSQALRFISDMALSEETVFVVLRDPYCEMSMAILNIVMKDFVTKQDKYWLGRVYCRFITGIASHNGTFWLLMSDLDSNTMAESLKTFLESANDCPLCFVTMELKGKGCLLCKTVICDDCAKKYKRCQYCEFPTTPLPEYDWNRLQKWNELLESSLTYTESGELPSLMSAIGPTETELDEIIGM